MVFKKVGCLGFLTKPTQPAETAESSSGDEQSCNSHKIRLTDGRLLAYSERGVSKDEASYRVIIVHGFASSKEMKFTASQVNEISPLN